MKYRTKMASLILLILLASPVHAYEVIDVGTGATVTGTVSVRGPVPVNEPVSIDADIEYCTAGQKKNGANVPSAGMRRAVVWLEGIDRGKAFKDRSVDVTIDACRVEPLINVGFVGGTYDFRNQDDILHTIQLKLGLAYQKRVSDRPVRDGATIYNLALPIKDLRIHKPIKRHHRYTEETGYIQVRSNTHTWMKGYIFVFDHPYAVVTDDSGTFAMHGVLPGRYTLKSWHEGFGVKETQITVTENGTQETHFDFGE